MPTNKPLLRLPRPSISPYSPPGGGSRDSSYNPSVQIPRIDERITRLERIFTEENVEYKPIKDAANTTKTTTVSTNINPLFDIINFLFCFTYYFFY